jgi:hypothetical protein
MMDSLDNSSLNRKDLGFVWDSNTRFGKITATEAGFENTH